MNKKATFSSLLIFGLALSACSIYDILPRSSSSSKATSSRASRSSSASSSSRSAASSASSSGHASSAESPASQVSSDSLLNASSSVDSSLPTPSSSDGGGECAPIRFYFVTLSKNGDATYIKAGDNDILIDAGSTYADFSRIQAVIDAHCTDGELEYVIASHAHLDHISAFTNNAVSEAKPTGNGNGILFQYQVGTLIDYGTSKVTSQLAASYYPLALQYAVSQGAVHYSDEQCVSEIDGAKRSYALGAGLTMEILPTKYTSAPPPSSDENDNSVCVLFRQGENSMLFTGDLEQDGIDSLLSENDLPSKVSLCKAGHHGSSNACSKALLSQINPDNIVISSTAGYPEYTNDPDNVFPYSDTITTYADYTKNVYVAQSAEDVNGEKTFADLNGDISFSYDEKGALTKSFSHNDLPLAEQEWFSKTNDLYQATWTKKATKSTVSSYSVGQVEEKTRADGAKIKRTVTAVNSSSPYEITYSCLYSYTDSDGVSHENEATMPNRIWPKAAKGSE